MGAMASQSSSRRHLAAWAGSAAIAAAVACGASSGDAAPEGASGASGTAGGATSASPSTSAAPSGAIDPSLFDCTSLARPPLPRRATSPAACLRDPACKMRLVTAHRGAGGQLGRLAPEDTLAAYRAGIAIGVDFVETDPRPTKDGVIVNIHDTTVDRTTSGTGRVDQLTYAEIAKLAIETQLPGDFSCERVPTLREVLETSRERAMVLVDANKTDRVDLLVEAIRAADALEWAIFDTSSVEKIDAALALEPSLMIMPRVKGASEAAQVLAHFAGHKPVLVELDDATFPDGVDVVHAAGTRAFTNAFGLDFGVKSGASPSVYLPLYDKGADVLQSDLPDAVLVALGRPVPPP